jgi:hexosaminidase
MKCFLAVAVTAAALHAQTVDLPLMPMPEKVSISQGRFSLEQDFRVTAAQPLGPRLERAVQRFSNRLSKKTGMAFVPGTRRQARELVIRYARATADVPKLGDDESYRLRITGSGAELSAETDTGVLRGLETFLQLVQPWESNFSAPLVSIEDRPRFPWRGLMLDVCRHWMPAEVVKRTLDGMAAVKMNVFHWHLSDDQGFRIESRRFPRLHEMGSDGKYFTQAEVRDIVAYAADRGIRVIPEFDIPGHTTSWLVGYPELATIPRSYSIERQWGIFDPTLDPSNERVYEVLDGFIGEMAALFPDAYFHIGGDEVSGKDWTASDKIAAFKKTRNLRSNEEVHAYFNRRVAKIVAGHGKKMIGWDEILSPALPKDTVVHSWRGQKSLAEAARQGYQGILSAGYYLDHILPASTHYGADPLEKEAADLTTDERARVLGGEACMWVEYVTPLNVDSRIWPRTAAIAERFWSPQNVKDSASMYRRLEAVGRELEWVGLTHKSSYRPMLERIANQSEIEPLRVVADLVEPPKFYQRGQLSKYTSFTPMNRLVDAARPESDAAREFGETVQRYLATRNAADGEAIRNALTRWRNNDERLQPMASRSFLMKEVARVSAELRAASEIGLEALAALERGGKKGDWVRSQKERLKAAAQPHAEVLLMIVPHVSALVEASQSLAEISQ